MFNAGVDLGLARYSSPVAPPSWDTAQWVLLRQQTFPDNGARNPAATGYAYRDFLGKYAKDFPAALEPCVGVPLKRKG